MKVSIGMLAWNESKEIELTLDSLFSQSLFITEIGDLIPNLEIDFICIVNGSTDGTEKIASDKINSYWSSHHLKSYIRCRVESLPEAGKANAWNQFIHHYSDPLTDVYFLMDADIRFIQERALENMLLGILNSKTGIAVTDTPIKEFRNQKGLNCIKKSLIFFSSLTQLSPGQLCGQMYGIKGEWARAIWIPKELIIDDGFLKEMIVTNGLKDSSSLIKIIKIQDASHTFDGYLRLMDLYRHQIRQLIGQAINSIVFEYLKKHVATGKESGLLINKLNIDHPQWVHELVKQEAQKRFWLIPKEAIWIKFKRLNSFSLSMKIFYFPVVLAGFMVDIVTCMIANYHLRRLKNIHSIWPSKKDLLF